MSVSTCGGLIVGGLRYMQLSDYNFAQFHVRRMLPV